MFFIIARKMLLVTTSYSRKKGITIFHQNAPYTDLQQIMLMFSDMRIFTFPYMENISLIAAKQDRTQLMPLRAPVR
jgi:hypothetical protein